MTTRKTKKNAAFLVAAEHACPQCGERDADQLVWKDDEKVYCHNCGTKYSPGQCRTPTLDAVSRIAQIADAQRRIAAILAEAAKQVSGLNLQVVQHETAIRADLKAKRADARTIAKALADHAVRTGDLNSRLVDAIQTCGERVFPTPYTPIASKWALIENRD